MPLVERRVVLQPLPADNLSGREVCRVVWQFDPLGGATGYDDSRRRGPRERRPSVLPVGAEGRGVRAVKELREAVTVLALRSVGKVVQIQLQEQLHGLAATPAGRP